MAAGYPDRGGSCARLAPLFPSSPPLVKPHYVLFDAKRMILSKNTYKIIFKIARSAMELLNFYIE